MSGSGVFGSLARHTLRFLSYGVVGALITLIAGALWIGVHRVARMLWAGRE